MLRKEHFRGILDRPIHLHCLDLQEAGPRFGAKALEALQNPGGPLDGLDITFRWWAYDWRETEGLSPVLGLLKEESVAAVSSEGALLDYGTDEEIAGNLKILEKAAPTDLFLVGTVTPDHEATRKSNLRFNLKPRTPGNFESLVQKAGWALTRTLNAPLSYSVLITH
jgi:hypothetical protein